MADRVPPPLHGINTSTHTNCKKLHCPPSTQPGVLCCAHIDQKCELRITKVLQTRPAVLRPLSCSILRCGISPFATMHNVTLLAIKDRKRKKVILYKTGFVVCSRGPALALERQKAQRQRLGKLHVLLRLWPQPPMRHMLWEPAVKLHIQQ